MRNEKPEPLSEHRRELVLAEYRALRDESMKRMDHRVTLLVSSLTISGAILGFGVERKDGSLLLVAPVMAVLFGLLVLYHTAIVAEIAQHVATRIEAPMNALYDGAMGWHTRPERQNRFRGLSLLHLPIMLTVLAPTVAALVLAWQFDGSLGTKIPLAVLDGALVVYYLVQYTRRISRSSARADGKAA
ncbi:MULTISPECIES: hypothetical protein [Actinokineospora]|uniref:Uncharacterized protein n=1 Tax=Actinokineospora fastidiosa TaxID=1816 RepID=A0A918GSD5_9PSEU|nr:MULTISPECIES: hypothetical protein [Actinokineospora]UVS79203.1 hypothetical protein Actkin_02949 [Actinokineospora sp. UTMC 2448]GGS58682.1 hypothetical protein GCM10010171_62060 [Actinokineospora fastidiosa]